MYSVYVCRAREYACHGALLGPVAPSFSVFNIPSNSMKGKEGNEGERLDEWEGEAAGVVKEGARQGGKEK